jgi:hypothetical protein
MTLRNNSYLFLEAYKTLKYSEWIKFVIFCVKKGRKLDSRLKTISVITLPNMNATVL